MHLFCLISIITQELTYTVTIVGRVPKGRSEVAFSLKGLNGKKTYEAFFKVPLGKIATDPALAGAWAEEAAIDAKLK